MEAHMTPTSRLGLALAAVAVAGCATISSGFYLARFGDFTNYRTYAWAPADTAPTGDPRLEGNALVTDRLEGTIERRLEGLGYRLAEGGAADLLLHHHLAVAERVEVSGERWNAPCAYGPCGPRFTTSDIATLVLDVTERRTGTLVFRGWAQTDAAGLFADPERLDSTIEGAAARLVNDFPPAHDRPGR
jgi:hypothetical protein